MIYDFQYLPFSLGDILTWSVHQAVQAKEANWQPEEINYRCQIEIPHPMQPFIKLGEGQKYLGELTEAFLFNPFGLRATEVRAWPFRKGRGTEYMRDLEKLRKESKKTINLKAQTRFFTRHIACHKKLNHFYHQNGEIPLLSAPATIVNQTAKMISKATGKTRWICIHIRFRGYDKRWDLSDTARNADPVAWYGLLEALAENYRHTHAILLMGEIANYPSSFLGIPGVHSLRNFGGTLKNDLASIFAANAFLGSSSGFATAANFSKTPYVIYNVIPSGYNNYAIAETEEKLPFAQNQQLLSRSDNSLEEMLKTARRILPIRKVKTRSSHYKTNPDTLPEKNVGAFSAALLEQIKRNQAAGRPELIEKYFEAFEKVIPEARYTFEVSLARKIADKKKVIQDPFIWAAYRKITEIRSEAAWNLIRRLNHKTILVHSALPIAVRARELVPHDVRVRAVWNLLRRAEKLRVQKINRVLFQCLSFFWMLYYKLFYGLGVSYRSKGLNP